MRADRRITRIGEILRRNKLDELPQLFNVLTGDMSLVGPRPEVPEFMSFYTPEQRAIILSMRPGMTDYAAILFRDESRLLEQGNDPVNIYRQKIMPIKFIYYAQYGQQVSVANDIRIMLGTIFLLAFGRIPRRFGIECEMQISLSRNAAVENSQDSDAVAQSATVQEASI